MSELIELTAAAAVERIRARELDAAELFHAYRERAAADELNAFTWVADGPPTGEAAPGAGSPLAGVPLAVTRVAHKLITDEVKQLDAPLLARLARTPPREETPVADTLRTAADGGEDGRVRREQGG